MAAAKINLVLGSHAHVPYGADAAEFEKVYSGLLRPFISSLNKYPAIQAALHYSGVLLHWVERSHPELFMLIEDMLARKQVEILGGGFYEPILPLIPLQDKIGQIELLTTYLRKQFGKRPQGCWIPAFSWEQNLVSPLAACGMNYTFLSDRQFALAGGSPDAPCICEDQGKLITVFPVLKSLEAALAEKSISSLLSALQRDYAKRCPEGTGITASIFPRNVSAGADEPAETTWSRFFEELSGCESVAETVAPGKLLKGFNNLSKLSFPDSSDTADYMPSRRFIIVNPEAVGIYSKMVFTNILINQLRGDKSRKLSAREELWKAQGSDIFCRADGKGLHNRLLRSAAYSALLGAERLTREKGKFAPSLVPFDFNLNGTEEWLFQDARINCYVQSDGGGIFELDYLPKVWNYLDTCGGRQAFADRLLPPELKLDNLHSGAVEGGRLCGKERYEPDELDKVRRKLTLAVRRAEDIPHKDIEIEKTYLVKKDSVYVAYALTNGGTAPESFQFAPEIDLALPGEGKTFSRFFACKPGQADAALAQMTLRGADALKIQDIKNEVQITLSANRPFDAKVEPVCLPGDGEGPLYQAFCIMPLFPVSLEPGEKWEIEFTLKFSH